MTEPPARPRLAVVVLNWNGFAMTCDAVRSLLAQTWLDPHLVVVDNGSAGGEAARLQQEFGAAIEVLALPHNQGFAGGCNRAFERLVDGDRCDWVALLNNDAEADARWLEALVAAGEADPRIGAVGSRMRLWDDPDRLDGAGVWILGSGDSMPRGRGEPAARWNRADDVLSACGGAVLLRAAMLREIGTFRDDFFANFEDEDLLLRATVAGWRVRYEPRAEVRHRLNATIARVRDQTFDVRSVRNATWAWAVNLPLPVLLLNLPSFAAVNLGLLLVLPLCGRPAAALALLRGRLRALGELPAILAERRRLRPLRRAPWWRIWWAQRSVVVAAVVAARQRLGGRRMGLMRRAVATGARPSARA
ncbi:MAG: glycosyltransferase family 2 protein [Planctomycetota bacterium]